MNHPARIALTAALTFPGSFQATAVSAHATLSTQDDTASCNNTAREVDILPGDHNRFEVTCQAISFSVAGQEFSTPSKCLHGGAHYAGTVYGCAGKTPSPTSRPGWSGCRCGPGEHRAGSRLTRSPRRSKLDRESSRPPSRAPRRERA